MWNPNTLLTIRYVKVSNEMIKLSSYKIKKYFQK